MKASWIIVSYNTKDDTLNCIKSLVTHETQHEQEILVCDNDSSDGSPEAIENEFPQVKLIASKENLGFGRGCNRAIEDATGDLIILLNPDTLVHEGALDTVVDFLTDHPEVGMLGARLISGNGETQQSQRRFPTLWMSVAETLYLHFLFPKASWTGEIDKFDEHYERINECDWVSGAFIAAKREVLDRIGPLDERYFMYYEDKDWCYECVKAGWKVIYHPEVRVTHFGALSSSKDIRTLYPRLIESELLFSRKHYSTLRYSLVRMLLIVESLQRIAVFLFSIPFLTDRKYNLKDLFFSRVRGLRVAILGTRSRDD